MQNANPPVSTATPIASSKAASFFSGMGSKIASCCIATQAQAAEFKENLESFDNVVMNNLPQVGYQIQAMVTATQLILPTLDLQPEQLALANQILLMISAGANNLTAATKMTSLSQVLSLVQSNSQAAENVGLIDSSQMAEVTQYLNVVNGVVGTLNTDPTIITLLNETTASTLNPVELAKNIANILTQVNTQIVNNNLVANSQMLLLIKALTVINAVLGVVSVTAAAAESPLTVPAITLPVIAPVVEPVAVDPVQAVAPAPSM